MADIPNLFRVVLEVSDLKAAVTFYSKKPYSPVAERVVAAACTCPGRYRGPCHSVAGARRPLA